MSELSNITFPEVCDKLEAASSVVILTHMRPDADTLGSGFALRELLRSLGKRAEVINGDDIPKKLRFIFGVDSLRPELLPADFTPDLVVSVDVSASKLLGELEEEWASRANLAIDHHVLGTPFAKNTYVGDVGACGEIILDIYREFKARGRDLLNRAAATALYAAICSDTGSFKFESVTAETHMRIAELHSVGINHAEIARRLYDSRPISQIMATKAALNALHFYCDGKLAVINFTQAMMAEDNLTREDIDDIISLTRGIEGVEVGMSIKQNAEDLTLFKVSMRSNRVADVSKLCAVFGGGGHVRAGGCTVNAPDEKAAEEMLVREIEREIRALEQSGAFEGADEL
ncbi:MAG: DHH family phosphoesterase [Clostridia bacterium]|nr:DHH family phosphoesterase [Clostridia bacterium]